MGLLIPRFTENVLRSYNDIAITLYGIPCTLYVPVNLTALEQGDAYTAPDSITYTTYTKQLVWIEWYARNLQKLRKLGVFTEGESPIIAKFKNSPAVTIGSYISVPIRYIPETYDTDEFEVVDQLALNTYDSEVYQSFKIAPRRKK